jgi:hypothetical protein
MHRQDYLSQIIDSLAYLSRKVEINSSMNLTDLNIHAENFYRDLFNLALGYQLTNINAINPYSPAIDLGDKVNRIAIQVTSTSSLKKTQSTVDKFVEKELYKEYDRLVIVNLAKKAQHRVPKVGEAGKFQLDTTNDIWDYTDFARKIGDSGLVTLEKVALFLRSELKLTPSHQPKEVHSD